MMTPQKIFLTYLNTTSQNLENVAPPDVQLKARAVATVIWQFYPWIDRITSWYRSEEVNKAVGGVPSSRHLEGLAIDFVPLITPREMGYLIYGMRLPSVRKIIIYDTHVHVSFWDMMEAPRKTKLIQKKDGKFQELL